MNIKQSVLLLALVGLVFEASSPSLRGPIESGAFAAGSGTRSDAAVLASPGDEQRVPKVIELSGPAYERGLKHGKELRQVIARMVELWKKDLQAQTKEDPEAVLRRFSAETDFVPAITKWTPDLLDEIKGIAEGSGQPYPTMLAYQLVDELWVYLDKGSAHHCSSMGVIRSGSHPALVAQNMDLENFRDGSQVVLHIAESPPYPEQFVFTAAGIIATNGMNNRSIAIACNTLMELSASPDGLPVACVVRGVLARTSGAEVLDFVRTVKHASGQNYIIGVGDRVYDFEASANKVVEFRPAADGSVVYHTNHPLANDDWKPWHANKKQALKPEDLNQDNSHVRLSALTARLSKPASAIDEQVIKATLQSRDSKVHPICRIQAEDVVFSFGATIMTVSDRPYFQVTMGPPDRNKFLRLGFSK